MDAEKPSDIKPSDKTTVMCFGITHTLSQVPELHTKSGGTTVNEVDTTKYLGVMLDGKLTFKEHVKYVKRKATSRLKMLGKTRAFVGAKTSFQLYKTIMKPLFNYAGPAYDCLVKRNHTLCKNSELSTENYFETRQMVAYSGYASRIQAALSGK